jgi:adenylate cyclase
MDAISTLSVGAMFAAGLAIAGAARFPLQRLLVDEVAVALRPRRQFLLDLATFCVAGLGIGLFNRIYLDFPLESGLKIIAGCLTFGTFAALDNALLQQHRGLAEGRPETSPPPTIAPLTRTLTWILGALMVLIGLVIALVLIKNIDYLVSSVSAQTDRHIRLAILADIAFVLLVVVLLTIRLTLSFRRNFETLFALQIEALDEVEQGNLNARVPVATRDEFGVVSARLNRMIQSLKQIRDQERELFEMSLAMTSEIHLQPLLVRIMHTTAKFLGCERTTLFLHDRKQLQLWSVVAEGLSGSWEIRVQDHQGIVGHVFQTGETLNIADVYTDSRFDPKTDALTGFRTENILCVPVVDRDRRRLGVIQALNKRSGPFSDTDVERLGSFSAQAAIALVNAQLFEDVSNMRNYDESILKSLSDGVITLDTEGNVTKINRATMCMLGRDEHAVGRPLRALFGESNHWVTECLQQVNATGEPVLTLDSEIALGEGRSISVNLSSVPLIDLNDQSIGAMFVLEDITSEKRLRGAMSRYMTKEVADRVLESGEFALGGSDTYASVLFSDIRAFTSLSETLGASGTVSLLNEYFSVMVDRVFERQGILDKYIGDAIMAVFGAPFSTGCDADNAVATAIGMMEGLAELNQRRAARTEVPIDIGVGISTGQVVAGNIGSNKRMDYTVIGDTVNLASRLEGINKLYGSHIVVSDSTVGDLQEHYRLRELDRIRVKGKDQPAVIHEVLDYHTEKTFPQMDRALRAYSEAMGAYLDGNWAEALNQFGDILRIAPQDGPSKLYTKRCRQFLENPPGRDWDGVWTMDRK